MGKGAAAERMSFCRKAETKDAQLAATQSRLARQRNSRKTVSFFARGGVKDSPDLRGSLPIPLTYKTIAYKLLLSNYMRT